MAIRYIVDRTFCTNHELYKACPEGKDTSRVGRWETFILIMATLLSTLILYL